MEFGKTHRHGKTIYDVRLEARDSGLPGRDPEYKNEARGSGNKDEDRGLRLEARGSRLEARGSRLADRGSRLGAPGSRSRL